MEHAELLRTGLVALLFAAIFAFGGPLQPLRGALGGRGVISFGAGMSAAYVFVHVMPELHGAREALNEARPGLRWQGMATYFVALLGFLAFYALGHRRHRGSAEAAGRAEAPGNPEEGGYGLKLAGFAIYVWLLGYLLVRSFEDSGTSTLLFALAIGGHLLSVLHAFAREHAGRFLRRGRYVLAAMAPLGWGAGVLLGLPPALTALLVAFVSGAVIVNSAVTELPTESGGRLGPFLLGGLLYGVILLPLG